MSSFAKWNLIFWAVAFSVVLVMELLGVFDSHFATITALTRKFVPLWARAMICGWVCYHFVVAPANWIGQLKSL